jgi:hypothetical protein
MPGADRHAVFVSIHAQAAAVEVQEADLGRSAIDEREQVSRQRILVHDVPSQRVETVERQAHIDRLPVQRRISTQADGVTQNILKNRLLLYSTRSIVRTWALQTTPNSSKLAN